MGRLGARGELSIDLVADERLGRVESFGPLSPNAVILPRWVVTAIAVVPGGAHPSYAHGYYKRDNAFYKAWDAIARDRDSFSAWMQANVLSSGPEAFREHAGKAA